MAATPEDVVKAVKAAREEAIGFAFGVGGNPAGHILLAERGKTGQWLIGQAKKHPGVKQSCGGTVIWDGAAAVFSCEKPISGLNKHIEAWAKANRLTLKTNVLSGKAEEEATEGDDEQAGAENDLFAPETIEKRLKQAKTKAMNFAFGFSAKGNLLAMHPLWDGEKLFRMIKAENGAAKKSWGTVAVEGATATFACADKPVAGLKRFMRELFKGWKLAYRVVILGPEGEEADEEEAEADAGQDQGGAAERHGGETDAAGAVADLRAELAALLPRLQAVGKAEPALVSTLREHYQLCERSLAAGDVAPARAAFERLQAIVTREGGGSNSIDLDGLRHRLAALLAELKPIVARDPVRGAAIREAYAQCDKAIKAADGAGAEKHLAALQEFAAAEDDDGAEAKAYAVFQADLETRVRVAVRAMPAERTALTAAWTAMTERAANGDFSGARVIGDRLAEKVDAIAAMEPVSDAARFGIPEGLVEQRRAEIERLLAGEVERAQTQAQQTIGGFSGALEEIVENAGDFVREMTDYVASVLDQIRKEIATALASGGTAAAHEEITAWQQKVAADKRLAAVTEAAGAFRLADPAEAVRNMFSSMLAQVAGRDA